MADHEVTAKDAEDIAFINRHLGSAVSLHAWITNTLRSDSSCAGGDGEMDADFSTSVVLRDDTQAYLRDVLHRCSTQIALRRQIRNGMSLQLLHCLCDDDCREDFVRVAASPCFAAASL